MCYYVEYLEKFENYFLSQLGEVLDRNRIDAALYFDDPIYYFVGGFEHPKFPVVVHEGVETMEWGLIPYWVKDPEQAEELRRMTINAVSETAFAKPSFRESIAKRRGLLHVTAFFEWREVNGKKYPYRISLKDQKTFAIGCIYDKWVDRETGEVRTTFSILTTEANEIMAKIHNKKKRMPVIISRADYKKWLDPNSIKEEITQLMQPCATEQFTAYTISQFANSTRNYRNVPEMSTAVGYPEVEPL